MLVHMFAVMVISLRWWCTTAKLIQRQHCRILMEARFTLVSYHNQSQYKIYLMLRLID